MAFKALRIFETPAGKFEKAVTDLELDDLPPGELLVKIQYSSLNFKDALSATGNKGITKKYPHTPGIDGVGTVEISRHEAFAVNEEVIVSGRDLGMNTDGAWAEYIRVPAVWAIKRPLELSAYDAMVYGTAGITAASALHKMQKMGQTPEMGPVVVTGATGGVGSLSVAILAKAGYEVIAITGKSNAREYLHHLGAARVEARDFVNDVSGKYLLRTKWAGGIDTVGGNTLHTLLRGCVAEGSIVTTGLVSSPKLDATVYPFILNGVNLLGVGTAEMPVATRILLWDRLINEWDVRDKFSVIAKEVSLQQLNEQYITAIMEGRIMGRIVVKI